MNRTETVALDFDVDGTGPLLAAIHGPNENRHSWDPIPLDEHFRVIRVDLRGHGNSPEAAEAREVDTHYVHLADPDWFFTRLIDFDAATTETGS